MTFNAHLKYTPSNFDLLFSLVFLSPVLSSGHFTEKTSINILIMVCHAVEEFVHKAIDFIFIFFIENW